MVAASRFRLPFASGLAALGCLVLWFGTTDLGEWLAFDRQAVLDGQWWRLWSAHMIHFSAPHAVVDAVVLLAVGAVAEREFGSRRVGLALFLGAPGVSLVLLLLVPELAYYRGVSALSVMLAVAGGLALWRSQPQRRPLLLLCAIAMGLKIGLEMSGITVGSSSLPGTIRTAWQAHVAGGILGLTLGIAYARQSIRMQIAEMPTH